MGAGGGNGDSEAHMWQIHLARHAWLFMKDIFHWAQGNLPEW